MRFPGFARKHVEFLGGIAADTISEATSGSGVTIDGVKLKDSVVTSDQVDEKSPGAGVTVDGCLIKDGAVEAVAAAATFISAEITGNGAAQATPHGLAATPTRFFAFFTELDGNAADIGTVTADATNLTVTVTTAQKYRLYATL
jgi:hypothetical protein